MLARYYTKSPKEVEFTEYDFLESPKSLTHNYSDAFLKWPAKSLVRSDEENEESLKVRLVVTNFRIVFELVDAQFSEQAPQYIRDFFEVYFG